MSPSFASWGISSASATPWIPEAASLVNRYGCTGLSSDVGIPSAIAGTLEFARTGAIAVTTTLSLSPRIALTLSFWISVWTAWMPVEATSALSRTLRFTLWPATPPVAFTWATAARIPAAMGMPTELVGPDRSTVAPMLYGALAAVVCVPEPDDPEEEVPEEEQADKARAETAATARAAVGMRLEAPNVRFIIFSPCFIWPGTDRRKCAERGVTQGYRTMRRSKFSNAMLDRSASESG